MKTDRFLHIGIRNGRLVPEYQSKRGIIYITAWKTKDASRKRRYYKIHEVPHSFDEKWLKNHPEDMEHAKGVMDDYFKKAYAKQQEMGISPGTLNQKIDTNESTTHTIT